MDAPLARDEEPLNCEMEQTPRWSLTHRIVFRFLCAYLLLYTLGTSWLELIFKPVWNVMDIWLSVHLFHLSGQVVKPVRTGSGDTALDYVQVFSCLVLAALAALAWSVIDRKRQNYRRADAWLRIWIRYTLALTLLTYGFGKVFPLQFGKLGVSRLFETYGESSPMGLLWTFMAASVPYTMFGGLMEFIPGLLLFFRRTAIVGALMATAVMLNVVMLNFCYDVPVKLYSMNLFFMALFLVAPYFHSIGNLLVLRRATEPPNLHELHFHNRRVQMAATAIKVVFVAGVVALGFVQGWRGYQHFVLNPPKPPLYGAWDVETFTRDGVDVPPSTNEAGRWKRLIAEYPMTAALQNMDDRRIWLRTQYDAPHSRVTIGADAKSVFSYSQPDSNHLVMQGTWMNQPVVIRLKKVDTSKLLLINRGFHWISQYPFNR
jgi:hypothetical protein